MFDIALLLSLFLKCMNLLRISIHFANCLVLFVWVQVEGWLNRIQSRMRSSLRTYMSEAVTTYEEKPRDQWLFDYPAQVSLCGTQIWWTTEVNLAFERLEEVFDHTHTDLYK